MRLALVTTTIHEPLVLETMDAFARSPGLPPDFQYRFFIAGDRKSPHDKIQALASRLHSADYIHPEQQQYKCSDLIGWNCVQRRNIATLEALYWGATHIYSWDTDNIPIDPQHFCHIVNAFARPFDGLMVGHPGSWFDPGSWQFPRDGIDPVSQRGFPQNRLSNDVIESTTNRKVGVLQGITLGDPDTSAVDRISRHPVVHNVSELYRSGVVLNPHARTVFNSQNTVFVRELAPAMFMLPHCGRYDDIFASLICQRVMRDRGYVLKLGQPFTWQSRNDHNLLTDLRNEIDGMETIEALSQALDQVLLLSLLKGGSTIEDIREIVRNLWGESPLPEQVIFALSDWCDDVEAVLAGTPR